MAADNCRFCLRPIDKAKSSDLLIETTKLAMLKQFLPEMNLDITENTEVCNNCMEELETSYNFKNSVVVNEANIQAKLEGKKQKEIDLKLMLDDVAKKELKKSDYICRTCLSICKAPTISLFDSPSNMMPYSFVKKMCEVIFELEFIASAKPVLCDDCWETLQSVYNFRKSCLRTDERLRIHVASRNVTKLSIDEFKKFAEENPVKDEDEDFSDDELGGYVKDEPIDEEELKIDPEEASCSSSSVKFKEETAVKSESELNSDDEDMEDKPELLDPNAVKSETSELDGGDCKMEIGDVKVDAEGEELKIDPEEASCSSSSVKVKEETAVKGKSELNSDNEDMEDKPELLDPNAVKSETSELDGGDCKMETGYIKVDAEGEHLGTDAWGGGRVAKRAATQRQGTTGYASLPIIITPSPRKPTPKPMPRKSPPPPSPRQSPPPPPPGKSMPLLATQTGDDSSDDDMFPEEEPALPDLLSPLPPSPKAQVAAPNKEHQGAAMCVVPADVEPVVGMVEELQLSPPVLHLPDVSPAVELPTDHQQLDDDDDDDVIPSSQTMVIHYVERYAGDIIKHVDQVRAANDRMATLQQESEELAAEKQRLLLRLQSIDQAMQTNKQAMQSTANERDSGVTHAKQSRQKLEYIAHWFEGVMNTIPNIPE